MMVRIFFIVLALCCMTLQGCGLLAEQATQSGKKADAASSEEDAAWPTEPVPYTTSIRLEASNGRKPDSSLKGQMENISELLRLKNEPPDGLLGLERRARGDAATALQLLHAQGYYDGTVSLDMQTETRPAKVTLRLVPGPRYAIGETRITYIPEPVIPDNIRNPSRTAIYSGISALWGSPVRQPLPPPDFSPTIAQLHKNSPAVADTILAAVERLPDKLHRRGYPFATITATRYLLDREKRTLDVQVDIDPGPPATLGNILVVGNDKVSAEYLHRLLPWSPGEDPWNQFRMERFGEQLRELGLFRSVEVRPAQNAASFKTGKDAAEPLPIEVRVSETPAFRTLGAEAHYDTATGLGVNAHWEHRNAFGNGEKVTVDLPYSYDKKGLETELVKPAVGSRHTTFRSRLAAGDPGATARHVTQRGGTGADGGQGLAVLLQAAAHPLGHEQQAVVIQGGTGMTADVAHQSMLGRRAGIHGLTVAARNVVHPQLRRGDGGGIVALPGLVQLEHRAGHAAVDVQRFLQQALALGQPCAQVRYGGHAVQGSGPGVQTPGKGHVQLPLLQVAPVAFRALAVKAVQEAVGIDGVQAAQHVGMEGIAQHRGAAAAGLLGYLVGEPVRHQPSVYRHLAAGGQHQFASILVTQKHISVIRHSEVVVKFPRLVIRFASSRRHGIVSLAQHIRAPPLVRVQHPRHKLRIQTAVTLPVGHALRILG